MSAAADAVKTTEAPKPLPNPIDVESILPKIFRVAWMSIGLGIFLEILLLMLAAFSGTQGDSPRPMLADLAQKVSWSFLVCVGLAFGTAARRLREAVMGTLGFFAAPAAFTAAKAVHKGLGQALGIVSPGAALVVPLLIAGLKAAEYGVLGFLLGRISKAGKGVGAHLAAGLGVGVTFGTAIVWAMSRGAASVTALDLASKAINEVLFPIGCSMVISASEAMSRRVVKPL